VRAARRSFERAPRREGLLKTVSYVNGERRWDLDDLREQLRPRLARRGCWADHDGELPVIEGTLIRLHVEHLPGDRDPKPVWLSSSVTSATDVDRWWQSFLRRFDLEHTFRLLKQTLGGPFRRSAPRTPHAAGRWTWLVIAAHTQIPLARALTQDLRRPWERPAPPGRLTPVRVRRGFRHLRAKTSLPASAPEPNTPGPVPAAPPAPATGTLPQSGRAREACFQPRTPAPGL